MVIILSMNHYEGVIVTDHISYTIAVILYIGGLGLLYCSGMGRMR